MIVEDWGEGDGVCIYTSTSADKPDLELVDLIGLGHVTGKRHFWVFFGGLISKDGKVV